MSAGHRRPKPAISVLLPVYNAERFLAEAIASILSQTDPDFELLLLNDGSTDRSPEILKRFEADDPRCTVLGNEHLGLVGSLNLGLSHARADLVARMDADDLSHRRRFAEQRAFMRRHPDVLALGCRVLHTDARLRPIFSTHDMPILHAHIERDLLEGKAGAIVHSALMVRTAALQEIGGYRSEYDSAEDADLFLRLAEIGELANLDDIYHTVRNHFQSVRHLRLQDQRRLLRRVVDEAWRRRGLEPPRDQALPLELLPEDTDAAEYERWRRSAWVDLSVRNDHRATAKAHSWWLVRDRPFSRCSWRSLLTAYRRRRSSKRRDPPIPSFSELRLFAAEENHDYPADSEELRRFKDLHRGERCFILGNGPSLNLCDLSLLENEATFAVNAIFYKTEETGFRPTYYAVEDAHVMRDNVDRIRDYRVGDQFFPSVYRAFLDPLPHRHFFMMNVGFYQQTNAHFQKPRFSLDCAKRIYCGQTVTFINLQLAYYMGFTKVYLIGMDFDYIIPESALIDGAVITSTDEDPNHFHRDYFGPGKKWHDPRLDLVARSYEKARERYEADGREIFNATVGGKLELFERVEYESLFKEA